MIECNRLLANHFSSFHTKNTNQSTIQQIANSKAIRNPLFFIHTFETYKVHLLSIQQSNHTIEFRKENEMKQIDLYFL